MCVSECLALVPPSANVFTTSEPAVSWGKVTTAAHVQCWCRGWTRDLQGQHWGDVCVLCVCP